MIADPIPFRIRVGVLGRDVGAVPDATDSAALASRLLEVVPEEVPALLDPESKELARTHATSLAFTVVTISEDQIADGVLATAALPAGICRIVVPVRPGGTKTPEERLVDDCDVVVVLSDRVPSEAAADGGVWTSPSLTYAALRKRPAIVLSTRDGSTSVQARAGIDARSISSIDFYNRWSIQPDTAASYSAAMREELFGATSIPEANREVVQEYLIPHYVRASIITKHFQRRYLRTARLVYVLAVAAVASVAVAVLLHPLAAFGFGLELAILITIFSLIQLAHRSRAHEKWLQARFLAERLRHALHLVACGVQPVRHRLPPHVGGRQPPDLWMVGVFDEILDRIPELPRCDEESCQALTDFARKSWVGGQLSFHSTRAVQLAEKNRRLEKAGLWTFGLAIMAAAAHLVLLAGHALHIEWMEMPWLDGSLTWMAIVLPAAGASVGGYRAHREYSRLAKRSAAMASALEDMEARLERVSNAAELRAMLAEIESWMVEEAQGWLMLLGPLRLEAV